MKRPIDDGDETSKASSDTPARLEWKARSARQRKLTLILAPLMLLGAIGGILQALQSVRDGRGGELFRTAWGFKASHIGALVAGSVGTVAMIVGSVIARRSARREEREVRQVKNAAKSGRRSGLPGHTSSGDGDPSEGKQ